MKMRLFRFKYALFVSAFIVSLPIFHDNDFEVYIRGIYINNEL